MAYAIFQNQIGKMGHFKKMNIKKRGISNKMHVINFKSENEPKMKWGISKKKPMQSREKYIFHMLFGAFHNTSRILKFSEILTFRIC